MLTTSALTLTYKPTGSDTRFTPENLKIELTVDGQPVTWHPGLTDTENLQGTTRTLDGATGSKTREPIEPGLVSRSGWSLVDDSTRPLFDSSDFSFKEGEKSPWPWVMERPAGERQDLYFFGYGHDYRKALGDYVKVAGRIPLPPRFAFGAWWSRYWDYTDQESTNWCAASTRTTCLSMCSSSTWVGTSAASNWKRWERRISRITRSVGAATRGTKLSFPTPTIFSPSSTQKGLKTTLNLHPASGVEAMGSLRIPPWRRPWASTPQRGKYVPFNITDKKFATNYMNLLHHPLEKQGIDFWWLDWQQEQRDRDAGRRSDVVAELRPLYRSATRGQAAPAVPSLGRVGQSPLPDRLLGRHGFGVGFAGVSALVHGHSGECGLRLLEPRIGGHMPGAVEPELYTRWVQFGAFSPILRTHTTKNPETERRIWAYPEPYSAILRSTFQLRYALEPYVYTEARRTYDTGVAFFRPLYYDWPEAAEAYESKGEYVFGDQMLAAPVTTPADKTTGLATEKIWLPERRVGGMAYGQAPDGANVGWPAASPSIRRRFI